jgi:hypothetical protein
MPYGLRNVKVVPDNAKIMRVTCDVVFIDPSTSEEIVIGEEHQVTLSVTTYEEMKTVLVDTILDVAKMHWQQNNIAPALEQFLSGAEWSPPS